MPPPGLRIYIRLRVTLTFDPLIPELIHLMPLPRGPLVPISIKIDFTRFQNIVFTIFGTNERTFQITFSAAALHCVKARRQSKWRSTNFNHL